MVPVQSNCGVGVCSITRFAEQAGYDEGVILGWVKKGDLPTKKIGKYTLIILALFNHELLNDLEVTQDIQF